MVNICPKRGARHLRPRSINFLVEGCCVGWRVCLLAVPSSKTTSKVHSLESQMYCLISPYFGHLQGCHSIPQEGH